MKKIKVITLLFVLVSFFCCSDDLDQSPQDEISPEVYWGTANDLKLYLNQFYTSFSVHQNWNAGIFEFDNNSDNLASISVNRRLEGNFGSPTATDAYWDNKYKSIRAVNYYIENSGTAKGNTKLIAHYNGEAYFFRAMFYFELLKSYGGVPYIDKVLNTESPELYSARMPRNELATKIIEDLDRAIANLKPQSSTEEFRVHQGMALALKSTVGLYEGTWEKYHNGTNFGAPVNESVKFLEYAVDASKKLIDQAAYSLYNNGTPKTYWDLFNQHDYTGNTEVLFWKKYDETQGVIHRVGHYIPHTGAGTGVTKSLVDSYLCIDGKPISVSPLYKTSNETSLTNILVDRDPRLAQTICSPGDLITENSSIPNEIFEFPKLKGGSGEINTTGFQIYKGGSTDVAERNQSTTGAIIFRYAEVLLNYAEAKAELGILTQADLDISVNLLRQRVGMPSLIISPVTDTEKAFPELTDIINEVRRERRVELALEGKRFDDLMRWAAADELIVGKRLKGFKIIGSGALEAKFSKQIGSSILVDENGNIDPYKNSLPSGFQFKEGRDYLAPIPKEQITLSKNNIVQNPGW